MARESQDKVQPVPLSRVRVAAPCNAEWRWMRGDDRVRFCGACAKNVFDLSSMTKQDSEDLIRKTEGQLCVRYYRRADGTILTTENCPVGLRALKRKLSYIHTALAAALFSFLANVGILSLIGKDQAEVNVLPVYIMKEGDIRPPAPMMGKIELTQTIIMSEKAIREHATFKVTPVVYSAPSPKGGQSKVVVEVIISTDGDVVSAICDNEDQDLRQVAQDAAYSWKFKPMLKKGEPVQVESTLTFWFGR
jgi:hypothetical protein